MHSLGVELPGPPRASLGFQPICGIRAYGATIVANDWRIRRGTVTLAPSARLRPGPAILVAREKPIECLEGLRELAPLVLGQLVHQALERVNEPLAP